MHKKSTWICTLALVIIQIAYAIFAKNNFHHFIQRLDVFNNGYLDFILIVFFLIAGSATIISSEFEYGTIKELLYRRYNRGEVLVSKWLTIFFYSLYWYILTGLVTLILNTVVSKINLGHSAGHGYTYLTHFLASQGANLLITWLLISLVFLLANIFNNSAVAVSVGIVGYFIVSVASGFLYSLIAKWEWVKWNPLTMLDYPNQITTPTITHFTKLSLNQLAVGNLVYIAIFLGIGYLVFKKRNV